MVGSTKNLEKKKIRIGVNIRIYEQKPSGIQNFIRGLFTELITNHPRYEFIFFSTGRKKIEKEAKYVIASSVFLSFFRKINPLLVNIFFDNFYILKLIYAQKLDIFIGSSYILPLFKPKNIKFITIVYDLSYLTYKHNPFKLYLNLVMYMKFVVPFVIKRADFVVVPSLYVKKQIIKKYHTNENKIIVIYGGVDKFFKRHHDRQEYDALRKKYNISDRFCFTNATNPERKNVLGLVSAFRKIDHLENTQLIITGLLPEKSIEELMTLIRELSLTEKVKFLGFVSKDEIRILYSYARIFIFPSFEEGFGFPVIEAAACGSLPICSNTGSLPELIGSTKLLFDPRNIRSMTQKINEVLSYTDGMYNKELELVKKHVKKYTWKNTARKYDELFEKMIIT